VTLSELKIMEKRKGMQDGQTCCGTAGRQADAVREVPNLTGNSALLQAENGAAGKKHSQGIALG
jgi:hypothetical protein